MAKAVDIPLMERFVKYAFFILPLVLFVPSVRAETIISKADADNIFSLNKAEWEAYARKLAYAHPQELKVQLAPFDTGTAVNTLNTQTGFGLSIQPMYIGNSGPPAILRVGSYYPLGSLPPVTDDIMKNIEKDAGKDLGPGYSVSASYTKLKDTPFIGVELMIRKK